MNQAREILKRIWGFEELRPLQEEAIQAAIAGRDSLVVMPTGGGKSLCFQLPPLVDDGLTLVISPLIALMKDQVDGLKLVGYPAEALHSNLDTEESARILKRLAQGQIKLIYLSPERLFAGGTTSMLREANGGQGVRRVAIDEAHCISQWGHDFRPEYRQLRQLRNLFPGASVQALTATATPKVRDDIAAQLGLQDPAVLVGLFDRPNLTYRVVPKIDPVGQSVEVIKRHPDDAAIVYCLSRKDTESMASRLRSQGINATAYHAGMTPSDRQKASEDFAQERVNVVVATVAFGMGIDRSNVRVVIHESVPSSIEAYQQETGRAGRDGMPSECLMLYGPGDVGRRERLLDDAAPQIRAHRVAMLHEVRAFAMSTGCRHAFLTEYFGQSYPTSEGCGACDICLEGWKEVEDSTKKSHMILAMMRNLDRQHESFGFGAAHVAGILAGSGRKNILKYGHQELKGYGAMSSFSAPIIGGWINQLADQGYLERTQEVFPSIHLSPTGAEALSNRLEIKLRDLAAPEVRKETARPATFDHAIFERLRAFRREIAVEKGVPAYVVFHDSALVQLASFRPTTPEALAQVPGVGERKANEFGPALLELIQKEAVSRGLTTDLATSPVPIKRNTAPITLKKSATRDRLYPRFRAGESLDEIVSEVGLAYSTISDYLATWIAEESPVSIAPWVNSNDYDRVKEAVDQLGFEFLKPIHEVLGGEVDYNQIRISVAHLKCAVST